MLKEIAQYKTTEKLHISTNCLTNYFISYGIEKQKLEQSTEFQAVKKQIGLHLYAHTAKVIEPSPYQLTTQT